MSLCTSSMFDLVDRAAAYADADLLQTINMLDGDALRGVIETEKPDLVVPEIEAIATWMLVELENEGVNVIPTARAARGSAKKPMASPRPRSSFSRPLYQCIWGACETGSNFWSTSSQNRELSLCPAIRA